MAISVECFAIHLSDVKDIVVTVAAVITAYVAIQGLRKWEIELKGKAYFEASKELAKSVYKVRREIGYCRSPFIPPSEFPKNYAPFNATPKEKAEALAHVYDNRWKNIGKAVIEFETACLEAEVLWGNELREAEKKLNKVITRLRVAIKFVVNDSFSEGRNFGRNEDLAEQMNKDVHAGWSPDEPDELENELNSAVEAFESLIKGHLRRS